MNTFFVTILLTIVLFLTFTAEAKAIILIVPVVLVPIVNILAIIIGALITPVIGLTAFYSKLKKKPIYKGILLGLVILIVLSVFIVIGFKLINPDRPLY